MTDNNIIIIQNNGPLPQGNLLLVFSTTWCGPCKTLVPILETLSEKIQKEKVNAQIIKIDCEANQELSSRYSIRQVPTIIFSVNGQNFPYTGARDENSMLQWIKSKL